jgi:hypothetical protein
MTDAQVQRHAARMLIHADRLLADRQIDHATYAAICCDLAALLVKAEPPHYKTGIVNPTEPA